MSNFINTIPASAQTPEQRAAEIEELNEEIKIIKTMISNKQQQLAALQNKLIRLKHSAQDPEQMTIDDIVGGARK